MQKQRRDCVVAEAKQFDLDREEVDSVSKSRERFPESRRVTSSNRDRLDGLLRGRFEPHM